MASAQACLLFLAAIFVAPVSHAQAQSSVVVQNTFDLAFALWSQVPNIYLQGSLVLTPDGLPPNPFTISDRNVTIQPVANATGIVTLDFGSLQTSHRVTVTNGAVVTLKRLQLKNYFFASLETRSYDTFMPFFVVEEQGRLQLTDIQMSMDPHRCQSRSDYPKFAESVRTPWLISLEPSTFQGGFVADANSNITYLVKSALVPQNYMRVSLTTVVPAQVGGHVQLAGTSFFCPPSSAPVPDAVAIASRVWANDQLNLALTQLDSRTILLQQNFSISTATSQPLVIANYRTISLLPAGTQDPKDDPTAMMDITLTSNATSDMWQVGYSGTLSISAITLRLASPCCTQLQLGSGWYFAGTLLAWRLFDTVLPASIQVLAVRYATLTPPAQMALTNVTLTYATCNESSWMPAVTQLESLTASPNASPMMAVYDRAARTLNCANCTFLGTAAEGPILLNQTSIVRLINTTVTCLSFDSPTAGAGSLAVFAASAAGPWSPSITVAVVVPVAVTLAVLVGLVVLQRTLKHQMARAGLERLPDHAEEYEGELRAPASQSKLAMSLQHPEEARFAAVAARRSAELARSSGPSSRRSEEHGRRSGEWARPGGSPLRPRDGCTRSAC